MKRMILALMLTLTGGIASAEQVEGVGSIYWSGETTASGGTTCVLTSTVIASATCALFQAGTSKWARYNMLTVTSSGGAGACCLVLDRTRTLNAFGITDPAGPNGSGRGACMPFMGTGGTWSARPMRTDLASLPGAETGVCRGRVTSARDLVHPPCDPSKGTTNNTDCTYHGLSSTNATCDTSGWTDTQVEHVGAYLICGGSYTTTYRVTKEAVVR